MHNVTVKHDRLFQCILVDLFAGDLPMDCGDTL